MKNIASLLFLLIRNSSAKVQQHCIFDGKSILAIQIVKEKGKPIGGDEEILN